jgi:hypothetical protein
VLQSVDGPVEFDRLVTVVATLTALERRTPVADPSVLASLPDDRVLAADAAYDQKRFLEGLWREILALPLRQRVAVLLGLRDGQGAGLLWVLPLGGVASLRDIAAALDMPAVELAEVWSRLPLDDRAIAERLGCTRQQVINLRSSARKRLGHRREERALRAVPAAQANTPPVSASLEDKA